MELIIFVNFIEKLKENRSETNTSNGNNSIRKNHTVNTGVDYEAYKTNKMLFIIFICMIISIATYRLITNKKES